MVALEENIHPAAEEYEDDEDEESVEGLSWNVGVLEPPEKPEDLFRHRFPSKVGGKPAWLDPVDLPTTEQLKCPVSGKPMQFLIQVYAPADGINASAFHRTTYVFISPQGDRLDRPGAVKAFRSQLPRDNPFYSFHPPGPSDLQPPPLSAEVAARLAEAQVADRDFNEMELIVEPDISDDEDEDMEAGEEAGEGADEEGQKQQRQHAAADSAAYPGVDSRTARLLGEYQRMEASEGPLPAEEVEAAEDMLREAGGLSKDRTHLAHFQAQIARRPGQVLRYCFNECAAPLTPAPTPAAPQNIPPCPRCQAPRQFEFQVLPQILHFLDLDNEDPLAPDFGTICVYSCSASCGAQENSSTSGNQSVAYAEEFVWVQPPIDG